MTAALPAVHGSIVAMLDEAAADFGSRTALVYEREEFNYSELRRCVAGVARLFGEVAPRGARIATVLGNSMVAAVVPYAIAESGCVHVPLNPLYTPRELAFMLADAAPAVVVVDDALVAAIEPLIATLPSCRIVISSQLAAQFDGWKTRELPAGAASRYPLPDDIALVQYTGGSTGRPKGVQLTHRAINTNIAQREALLPVARGSETVLCVMPLFHSYAMAMGLFLCGYSGSTLVIMSSYHPERLLAAIEQRHITIFPGSPTIFVGLMNCERFASTRWDAVHTCYSGSAALPAETLQRWEAATGSRIYEGYGQTEAGPVLTFNPSIGRTKIASVGIPVPETEVQVVDLVNGTSVLPAGERGEIRARGPQVMAGYLNLEQETGESLRDGWLYTGDIGELDEDGYLFIRDRKKDLVIVGGYNVYPREVEEVLYSHPAVLEAAVVGQADAYRGEILRAYVVFRPGSEAVSSDDLRAFCSGQLAKYKVPAAFDVLPALPKTSVNKIDKKPLKIRANTSSPS